MLKKVRFKGFRHEYGPLRLWTCGGIGDLEQEGGLGGVDHEKREGGLCLASLSRSRLGHSVVDADEVEGSVMDEGAKHVGGEFRGDGGGHSLFLREGEGRFHLSFVGVEVRGGLVVRCAIVEWKEAGLECTLLHDEGVKGARIW